MAELREALENAITQAETEEVATPEPVVAESPASEVAESSAVVSPTEESEPPAENPTPEEGAGKAEPAKAETPEEGKPDSGRPQHRVDRPPQSWKKEAKGEWASLPLHVRQEVYRREQQVNQVLNETAQHRQLAEQFTQVLSPYQARISSLDASPVELVGRLLQTEYALATGTKQQTAQLMAKLIKDYDVDIKALDNFLVGAVAPQSQTPDIAAIVQQQVQQALAPLHQQQQIQAQAAQQEAVTTVEEMALDPQYPFFEDVREDMADIVELRAKKGVYISLPDAYNIAIQMNPEVAGQVQKQHLMENATQQHQQAQRARNAASSVSGAPAMGGAQSTVGDGSLRGAIEAAFGGARV